MDDAWSPPTEIAEFRLERLLGRGATAHVWLARDTLLDRVVALKIASTPASEETRTRFRVEARAVAKLQHPNLLAIHHVGEVDERPFLVTDYLPGKSLDQLDRPAPPERVIAIGIDLARGLAAAHGAGVLHRDIKPANAFLGDDGVAKLLDFGLAKLAGVSGELAETSSPPLDRAPSRLSDRSPSAWSTPGALDPTDFDSTRSGNVVGTPLYMAPETWRGEPATRRTDIYSLGALLFDLLAGRPPCDAHSIVELHTKVLAGKLDDLAVCAPSAPAPLVELVMRCLSMVPEERPTADEICDALAQIVAPPLSALAEALDDPQENPYRGLLAFGPEHRALFFGREAETAAVMAELRANPFVLVAGSSGAGKSSLVRAGVVPKVEKGALAAGTSWRTAVVVPGRWPIDALAQAMAPLLGKSEADVRLQLPSSPTWLADEMRAARARVLLVVDQLEEIWTLATAAEREAFFAILAAITRSAPTVRVVATLRADFLGHFEDMGELQARALSAVIVLRPMAAEGLRRAIALPALRRGVTIERALVEHLVAHCEGGAGGSLPLLEFALGALYARRDPEKDSIGLADLEALGGVEGALATHADAALARLPTTQRREARRLLLALVTVERTRSRREAPDLIDPLEPNERAALDALVDARLVIASAGEHGAAYEVAHEALLSGWPTLRGWLAEEGAAREAAERVRRAAAEWVRVGRVEEVLFGERQLGELDALGGHALDEESEAFVATSHARVRRARAWRWTLRTGVPVSVLLLAATIGLVIRWSERRQAHAFVAARIAEADAATREVTGLDAQVDAARSGAFARYDAHDAPGGEAAWRDALALARRESDAFVAASAPLGLALARDPLDPLARARAADLSYLWFLAAERDHEPDVARDLAARVARLDDDGSRRARLAAPAHLFVTTSPPGAQVVIHGVRVEGDGRRVEDDGHAIDLAAFIELAPGSYVLAASAPGRYPTRSPVLLVRAQEERVEIPLPPASAVPSGFAFVPPGVSLFGAADVEAVRTALLAEPEHPGHVDGFLIAEHEVTFAEYLAFLATLPAAEREARRPGSGSLDLTYDREGVPVLAIGKVRARQGEPFCRPARSQRRCQDWQRFAVAGVAWKDAQAYAAWLARSVPGARLCSEREWERAARGADGRLFPAGDDLRSGDANFDATYASDGAQMGIDEVGSFPADRSPFGVFDLAGNVAECVGLDAASRAARGGIYYAGAPSARAAFRYVRADSALNFLGLRVCAAAPSAP